MDFGSENSQWPIPRETLDPGQRDHMNVHTGLRVLRNEWLKLQLQCCHRKSKEESSVGLACLALVAAKIGISLDRL